MLVKVKAHAPGSLMLLGEYAVMHGKHALICAVNKRIYVELTGRQDKIISIYSTLGKVEMNVDNLRIEAPFQFVLTALKKFEGHLQFGCDIVIESEFSSKIGFASSAAVTVATVKAITEWLNLPLTDLELINTARNIVFEVQGLGSGADVAACVLGGMVAYKMEPMLAEKISHQHALAAVYSGSKTPTVTAVKKVKEIYANKPELFEELCQAIDFCAVQGIEAAKQEDWLSLGKIMNIQQSLMEELGVSTPLLSQIVADLRQSPAILGAKISGSGFGDCLIGLGSSDSIQYADEAITFIPVDMTKVGVQCEKV